MGWFRDMVSELTGSSGKETSRAHHEARDHSGVRENRDTDHFNSAPDWAESRGSAKVDYFPEGRGPTTKEPSK